MADSDSMCGVKHSTGLAQHWKLEPFVFPAGCFPDSHLNPQIEFKFQDISLLKNHLVIDLSGHYCI